MKNYNTFIVERKIAYQKSLCPDIWENGVIIQRIETKLLRIARDFYEELNIEAEILDIVLTGSLANFNYTSDSDLDIHIIIDFFEINEDTELVKKAIDGQRFIWNLRHNIVIKGHDIELYIQDKSEEYTSTGIYSLLNHKWVIAPKYNPPNVDTKDVDVKYDARLYDIEQLDKLSKTSLDPNEAQEYYTKAKDLKTKIMKARKSGLSSEGEFSIENLVFKKLRKNGKIKKIIDITSKFYDMIYSQ